ncbi:cache domain-containing protein [Polaromonas jejuensis]|uniref:Cache domain-containing protein n=2 Tax=Polaromonas jejuensis TaxID=457502 RepID=A0ABW0QDS7_9BURK|nr:cache domain-containing protein [Polaromonas jejuensis]
MGEQGFRLHLRAMVLLLAAVPLLLAIAAVVWVVRQQSDRLAQAQIAAMQPILLQARKDELQHFVQIGRRAVARLYEQTGHDPQARQQALELLRRMDFGNDNYFFVYDLQGNSLMHPRLPDLEGHSQWELRDSAGAPIIQQLVRQAQAGGGFVDYMWNRPSTGRDERKLGYVELVPEWGWVMGTGLYLDHLQETQALITRSTAQAVQQTRQQILLIASAALLLVAGGGLALNLYEQRAADTKLRAMAQKVVHSQEDERSRVARELHDGISQQLLSVKFVAESALLQLERGNADAAPTLRQGVAMLQGLVRDVRRISHDLRPTLLDDVGLASALAQIAREFGERSGIQVETQVASLPPIPEAVATAVFRVAQEALGNIEKHAGAQHVQLQLSYGDSGLALQLRDDGAGLDVPATLRQARSGLGLTNMRERIEMLGGSFSLASAPGATLLRAHMPGAVLKA